MISTQNNQLCIDFRADYQNIDTISRQVAAAHAGMRNFTWDSEAASVPDDWKPVLTPDAKGQRKTHLSAC